MFPVALLDGIWGEVCNFFEGGSFASPFVSRSWRRGAIITSSPSFSVFRLSLMGLRVKGLSCSGKKEFSGRGLLLELLLGGDVYVLRLASRVRLGYVNIELPTFVPGGLIGPLSGSPGAGGVLVELEGVCNPVKALLVDVESGGASEGAEVLLEEASVGWAPMAPGPRACLRQRKTSSSKLCLILVWLRSKS